MPPTAPGSAPLGGSGQADGAGDWQDTGFEFRYPLVALALTTAVAGLVDAFTLLRYGVFTASQSGNIVHVGMGLTGRFPDWPAALASIVGFGVGGVLGARMRRAHRQSPPARELAAVIVAVVVWSVVDVLLDSGGRGRWSQTLLAGLAAVSLGTLAVLFVRTSGISTTTTSQTRTVLRVAQALSDWIDRATPRRAGARPWMLPLFGIVCYGLGGAVGARILPSPAWVFASTIAVLATLLATARRQTVANR